MGSGIDPISVDGVSKAWVLENSLSEAEADALYVLRDDPSVWNPTALGINFGSFEITDGELIVDHVSTTTPSVVDGDLILEYETF